MKLFLVFLQILAFSNAFPTPSPGKELIYNYNAKIVVGTFEPVPYASQFMLEGRLHLQHENKNATLVRFTDLSYKLYNGELNGQNEHNSKPLLLPQETVDLLKTFQIEYNEDGKLKNIIVESGEQNFVTNIKKSIASLLQLDRKNLQLENPVARRRAFVTEEHGLYGRGLEEYNVDIQENKILIQKMRVIKSSDHWYSYSGMNIKPILVALPANSPVSVDSKKLYTLTKTVNGEIDIKKIEANGEIHLHLLKGLIDAQFVTVNQELNLIEAIPIVNKYQINNGEWIDQVEFNFNTETESGVVVDLSFGRHNAKQEDFVKLIQLALTDAVTYLETNQLTLDTPDVRKGQAINRLQRLLGHVTIPTLKELYNTLTEKSGERDQKILKIFQQILPLVGSRATIIFIRNLIHRKTLDDQITIDMLNKMPFNLRMPSERLLQEVEDLADLDNNYSLNVRRAGVLSFASLVNKVYSSSNQPQRNEHDEEEQIRNTNPLLKKQRESSTFRLRKQNILLEKYINKFLTRVQKSEDYSTQMLNMNALYNIQINVNKHLEKYLKGEEGNHHLQFIAMWAALMEDVKDPERTYEIYWPIFTNKNVHLELRACAYIALMSTQITMNKLWNIYWTLKTEKCPELYNFVYTHLQSLAESKNPALRQVRIDAAQILRYIRKPLKKTLSGNYIVDYEDPKYDFGAMVHFMVLSTKTSKVFYIDITNNILDVPFQLQSIYLKIDGLDTATVDSLPKEKIIQMNIAEIQQLVKIFMSLKENKNIHIEFGVLNQNQIVQMGFYDQTNIKQLVDGIQNFQADSTKLLKNSLQIQYNVLTQLVMPNDLGLPTMLQIKSPKVTNNVLDIIREVSNKIVNINANIKLQSSIQTSVDVSFYNPIADIWQGVQRINSYDRVIPLHFSVAINSQQNSMKLTTYVNQDQQKEIIGLRNHVRNQVYIIGEEINNYLKQSNSQCNVVEEVSRGQQSQRTVNIMNVDDENTGLKYEIIVFDNERQISQKSIIDLINLVVMKENTNDHGSPLVGLLLSMRNVWSRIFIAPGIGTTGIVIRAIPSNEYKISQTDLSLRLNQEVYREENAHHPSIRINTRATYSVKQPENKLVKTWDVNAILEMNAGHTLNNLKIQITKIIPDQKDYKICLEAHQQWINNGVSGFVQGALGHLVDNKCVKDEKILDVVIRGEQSQNNTDINNQQQNIYEKCSSFHIETHLPGESVLPTKCIQKQTVIRKYVYNVSKMPPEFKNYAKIVERIINKLQLEISEVSNNQQVTENTITIVEEYSENNNEVNLEIFTPQKSHKISGIQVSNLIIPVMIPDNYHYTQKFLWLQRLGLINTCIVNQQVMINSNNGITEQKNTSEDKNDWVIYLRDKNDNVKFNIAIKKIEDQKMILRVVLEDQVLEIQQQEERQQDKQHQILLNGQPLTLTKNNYHYADWFSVGTLNVQHQSLILHVYNYSLYIDWTGQNIRMETAKSVTSLEGKCLHF